MDDIDPSLLPIVTDKGPGAIDVLEITHVLAAPAIKGQPRTLIITTSDMEVPVHGDSETVVTSLSERRGLLRIIGSIEYDEDDLSWSEAAEEGDD